MQSERLKSALTRVLRPLTRIEPSELVETALLTLTVFVLLTAYYLLKVAREPLILLHGGAEVKSYAAAGQAVLLLGFVAVYGALAQRVGRLKLLVSVYLFFVVDLLVFAALSSHAELIAVPFYLWVGIYNYTSIAQFWALAADIFTREQGTRLFAVLGLGSSLGAVFGSWSSKLLVPLGPGALMLGAAVLLLACTASLAFIELRHRKRETVEPVDETQPVLSRGSAFSLLLSDKYLLLLAALTLIINWVNTNGEYIFDRSVLEYVHSVAASGASAHRIVGEMKASYFYWTNVFSVVLQMFLVSRLLTRLGVRAVLFLPPLFAFCGYAGIFIAPALGLIRAVKITENSLDYSLENTARQALYLVTSRAEKYVGKTAVDSFFVRLGDVMSALVVWIGSRLALPIAAFGAINLVLVAVWLAVVFSMGRAHRQREGLDASWRGLEAAHP
ncbi:MAG TPA: MFS transporter [Polyangiaceae bacterium]|jgi:AAA family ATP:ADP antiporter|nr:MFS transporter [Polyangiaceae bacterium]